MNGKSVQSSEANSSKADRSVVIPSLSRNLSLPTLPDVKRLVQLLTSIALSLIAIAPSNNSHAETESIDLKALAKKARPAVMLLVVSDASGKEIATGTGFLISSDGKLITNHHVIEKGATALAKAENGGTFAVVGVLADDATQDVVLLRIEAKSILSLELGSSEGVEPGARIAVIGSPLGLEGSLSEGIVSAVRELPDKSRVLQITAAVSPGSSGSPVLNAKGEVIGVASAQVVEGQSLNFAVPVEVVKDLLSQSALPSILAPKKGAIQILCIGD